MYKLDLELHEISMKWYGWLTTVESMGSALCGNRLATGARPYAWQLGAGVVPTAGGDAENGMHGWNRILSDLWGLGWHWEGGQRCIWCLPGCGGRLQVLVQSYDRGAWCLVKLWHRNPRTVLWPQPRLQDRLEKVPKNWDLVCLSGEDLLGAPDTVLWCLNSAFEGTMRDRAR